MWKNMVKELVMFSTATLLTGIGGVWSIIARDDVVHKIKELRGK